MNPTLAAAKQKALEINDSVNKLATQQGKATQSFDSAGNRTMTPAINASNVPASMVDGTVPSVQMPPDMSLPADMGVVGAGEQTVNTLQEQYTRQAEEKVAQSERAIGQNERGILEAFGILQQEPEDRRRLEESEGVNYYSDAMRTQNETLRMQLAELREFDRNNVNTIEQMRVDASKRDITKRTFGAMSAEENIQNAVQRANKAADIYTSIASIDVMQGNFDRAAKRVDQALNTKYEPVRQRLELEKFFLERNDRRFDSAQKDLANTRMMQIQREQAQIDRAIELADTAVISGYATADEVQELATMTDPESQRALASKIIARGRAEKIAQERALFNAQMEKLYETSVSAPETKNFGTTDSPDWRQFNGQTGQWEPVSGVGANVNASQANIDIQTAKNTDLMRHINLISTNEMGIRALTAGGGAYQLSSLVKSAVPSAFAGAAGGFTVGSAVPGVGTAVGTIGGTATGLAMGTGASVVAMAKAKEDALSSLNYLLQNASFNSLRDQRTAGIQFGALSNAERTAAGAAADAISASLVIDVNTGQPIDVRGSYETFMENMAIVKNALITNQNRLLRDSLPQPISNEISVIFNE